jgi:hypothetical protein
MCGLDQVVPGIGVKHFLWALAFVRVYLTHTIFRAMMGCIQTGDIVWGNGPFKTGNWHDIMVCRINLKGLLYPGEMVEVDKGYRGGQHSDTHT